jgi:hypothetical protein
VNTESATSASTGSFKKKMRNLGHCFIILFVLVMATGWGMNLYKTTQLDFETPLKAEVFRLGGIFIAPVGAILGWWTFKEEEE